MLRDEDHPGGVPSYYDSSSYVMIKVVDEAPIRKVVVHYILKVGRLESCLHKAEDGEIMLFDKVEHLTGLSGRGHAPCIPKEDLHRWEEGKGPFPLDFFLVTLFKRLL